MKRGFTREFCLWLVPPHDGRVRKLRFTSFGVAVCAALLTFIFGAVVYLAGDYARVQMLRVQTFFTLQSLASERDDLAGKNRELAVRLEELRAATDSMHRYEQGVRERLSELAVLLSNTKQLGLFGDLDDPALAKEGAGSGGIGGLELDSRSFLPDLSARVVEREMRTDISFSGDSPSEPDLPQILDRYLDVVRTLPLGLPAKGEVSSRYGLRRSPFSGRTKLHVGMDFALPVGSPVMATADGVVASVRRSAAYGLVIDLQHGNRILTRYAHLSRVLLNPGDEVHRGQVVALVGNTGRSTGPHVHYEVRIQGKHIDPLILLGLAEKLREFA